MTTEAQIEKRLLETLSKLTYTYRPDIRDGDALIQNFKEKFEALNRVHLSNAEFDRLMEKIINPDVFAAAKNLREREQKRAFYLNESIQNNLNSRQLSKVSSLSLPFS